MNLETPQQAIQRLAAEPLSQGYKFEGLYPYCDSLGAELFSRIRLKQPISGDKWIRPMHRKGTIFVLGEPELKSKKPLYRLPEIVNRKDEPIWIVEGEPCADALRKLGILATTSGSSSSASSADWTPLTSRKIILWRDNDEHGLKYIQDVSSVLAKLGCEVTWIDVEKLGLPEKGDCVDWLHKNPSAQKADIETLPLIEPIRTFEIENKNSDDNWDDPILFDGIETPEIPASLLPGILGDFAKSLSTATETPEALSVMTVLGVISASISKKFKVSPKKGWFEPVNIYTLVALPPANNKSPVLNACIEPLVYWERKQVLCYKGAIERQISEKKTQEKYIERLRNQAARADDDNDRKDLIQKIWSLEKELKAPDVLPQIFATDTTPEALVENVAEQGGRFAIFSDEGGILDILGGLYTGGTANVDILLKGNDGGHIRVRRKSSCVDLNPYLSIVLTVQPVIIQNMGMKKSFQGKGVLERFLFALPKSKLGFRTHQTEPISEQIKASYQERILELINIKPLKSEGEENPLILELSSEALESWSKFQTVNEVHLKPSGKFEICRGYGGKICGFALRIAALMHVAEYKLDSLEISKATMDSSLELIELLIEHAIAAFGLMGVDEGAEDAREISQWIEAKQERSFTRTDLMKAMRGKKLGNASRLNRAMNILDERNIIRSEEIRDLSRRPIKRYFVNPKILNPNTH